MPAGFFLVLEGPEGSGKTTLAAGLAERLRGLRIDPVVVREPGGTPVAEALRRELLDEDRTWTPEMELLYIVTRSRAGSGCWTRCRTTWWTSAASSRNG